MADALEILIEIRTKDSEEIRKLLNDIDSADSKLRNIKSRPTSRMPSSGTGAPVQIDYGKDERTGIFSSFITDETLPLKGRDISSRAPFQRENEFKRLRDEVKFTRDQQNEIKRQIEPLDALFGGAILGQSSGKGIMGVGQNILGGGIVGGLKGTLAKLVPILGTALIAYGFVRTIIDILLQSGMPFDRRWKRELTKELASLTDRKEKQDIAQGLTGIRAGGNSGLRDEVISTNLEKAKSGNPIYNEHIELLAKRI